MKATMSKPEDLKSSFQEDTKLLLKLADSLFTSTSASSPD